ncbi:hypothetical protein GLOIN_2v1878016 [Rhizophagus clarus]|uniref:Uncharacterized protein n=1 Tax=Rhizophagus clarus TaxID=94130 RepID=A0A8H3LKK5_9GLOM|nr:hypothetical protein GLOIN_2v1878016 [Rhizophagus clarus]
MFKDGNKKIDKSGDKKNNNNNNKFFKTTQITFHKSNSKIIKINFFVITLFCTLLLLTTNVLTLPTSSPENKNSEHGNTTHELHNRKVFPNGRLECCRRILFFIINTPCSDDQGHCEIA